MRDNILAHLYTHDARTTTAQHPPPPPHRASGLSRNVIIGIILGIIALIACAIIAFLLWRLAREHRRERRQVQRVDLLGEARFSTIGADDLEKGTLAPRRDSKPLPRIPSSISTRAYLDGQNFRNSASILGSSTNASQNDVPVTRPPSVTYPNKNGAPSSVDTIGPSTTPPSTLSHSRKPSKSSVSVASHSRNTSNPFGTESSDAAEIVRGQFTVVNVTNSDTARLQRPQLVYLSPPEYAGRTRGRDQPFPSKMDRRARPPSIITVGHENLLRDPRVYDAQSIGAGYPVEKRRVLDVPSTPEPPTPGASYTVQIPPSDSESRGLTPRARLPVTITASRPVSNIVVEGTRTIRRPNGKQGKGRMVTMSVLVEDSDASTSDVDASENRRESRRDTSGSQDVLGNVLESYTTRSADLPPYTPREAIG